MLYKTGVEYGDYTMNHVEGCAHGCKFPCYAYLMKKRFGKVNNYDDWIQPRIVSNTLDLLDEEIPELKDKIHSVQLCFSTDPFMCGYPEVTAMSLAAIRKLNDAGIRCITLTKGKTPIELADQSMENEYGITLVSMNENFRRRWEPGTATYVERIEALRKLHEKGCRTWISMEPYPTPNIIGQDLQEILEAVSFTDRIVFGRMNYNRIVTAYPEQKKFYNEKAEEVMQYCREHNIECYIKQKTITPES